MFELLPIIIIGLVFAGISEKQSKKIVNDSGIVYYEKKDVVFYLIAVVVLATFVGLRKVYNVQEYILINIIVLNLPVYFRTFYLMTLIGI